MVIADITIIIVTFRGRSSHKEVQCYNTFVLRTRSLLKIVKHICSYKQMPVYSQRLPGVQLICFLYMYNFKVPRQGPGIEDKINGYCSPKSLLGSSTLHTATTLALSRVRFG